MMLDKQTDEEELFDIRTEMMTLAHYSFCSNIEKTISIVKKFYDVIKPISTDKSKYKEYVETILNKQHTDNEICQQYTNIRIDILFLSEQPMTTDMIDELIKILKDLRSCIHICQ